SLAEAGPAARIFVVPDMGKLTILTARTGPEATLNPTATILLVVAKEIAAADLWSLIVETTTGEVAATTQKHAKQAAQQTAAAKEEQHTHDTDYQQNRADSGQLNACPWVSSDVRVDRIGRTKVTTTATIVGTARLACGPNAHAKGNLNTKSLIRRDGPPRF